MIQLIILLLVYILIFFSISGYGSIILKKNNKNSSVKRNCFEYFFYGLPIVTLISFFYSIILPYSKYFNIFFLFTGLLIYFFNRCYENKVYLILFFFTGLLISQTHDDFGHYHYQNLKEIVEDGPTLGLGNLATRYVYSSIFTYVQSILYLPYFELNLFHVPIHLTYATLIFYLITELNLNDKINNNHKILIIIIIIVYTVKFSRLSEHGYDYLAQFFITYIFIKNISYKKNQNYFQNFYFYIYSILIKVSSMFYVTIFVYFVKEIFKKKNIITAHKKKLAILIILSSIFFINSFIKSGCINYVSKYTCFNENISWKVPYKEIQFEKNNIERWAKGYYHGGQADGLKESEYGFFSYKWVKHWIKSHFVGKISDYLALIFAAYVLVLLLSQYKFVYKKNDFLFSIALLFSFVFWFYTIPALRFYFFGLIILFHFFIFNKFFLITKIKKKIINVFFILFIIYFNFNNLQRINKDIKRTDFFKFSNFPFFNLPIRNSNQLISNNILYYEANDNAPGIGGKYCWNVKTPCNENFDGKKKIKLISKYNFKLITLE